MVIVVPAHNEDGLIAACVASLAGATDARTRILVVVHNCFDRTAEVAAYAGAEVLVLDDASRKGKGHALLAGMQSALARGAESIMIFDADSTCSHNLIVATRQAFREGAMATQCRYEMGRSGLASIAFRGMNHVRARGRSAWGLSCGIFGNGFTLRAEVLRSVPYEFFSIAEDVEYHLALVRNGFRVQYIPEATVLGESAVDGKGSEEQRARWEGGRLNLARRYSGRLLKDVLRGRLRLAEPLMDVCSLPLAHAAACVALLLLLQSTYGVALLIVVCLYLTLAIGTGESPGDDVVELLRLPAYILWKLRLSGKIVARSSGDAAWVRTERAEAHAREPRPKEDQR